MVKNLLKFSGRLILIMLAVIAFSTVGLTLIYNTGISAPLRMLAGLLFIAFQLGMVWDTCTRRGEEDCRATLQYRKSAADEAQQKKNKAALYFPAKGFIAGAIAMLIPLALTVACTVMMYHGWEKGVAPVANIIYVLLVYTFQGYAPFLTAATVVNPVPGFEFGVPAVRYIQNMYLGTQVMPYMFFIPIAIFIVACGVCYIWGYYNRLRLQPKIKKPAAQAHQETEAAGKETI